MTIILSREEKRREEKRREEKRRSELINSRCTVTLVVYTRRMGHS
jgi:hypothetical protein